MQVTGMMFLKPPEQNPGDKMKCTWKFWVWDVEGNIFQPASFNHYSDTSISHLIGNRQRKTDALLCIHLAQQTSKACNSCLSLKSLKSIFVPNEITSQMAQHRFSLQLNLNSQKQEVNLLKILLLGPQPAQLKQNL